MNTAHGSLSKASLVLLLGAAIAGPVASAQHNQSLARATVPFAFQYGSSSFPAGSYTFGLTSENIMVVRGPGKSAMGVVDWSDAKPSKTGKLVFHRNGEQLQLQDVYVPQLSAHLRCPAAKPPKHHELAATKPADTDVEVALLENDH